MRKISYYANKQSNNARINIYSNKNARKKLGRETCVGTPNVRMVNYILRNDTKSNWQCAKQHITIVTWVQMRTLIYILNRQCAQNTRRETCVGDPNGRIAMYSNHCSESGQAAWNKCANGKKTQDPTARIDIVLGSQFANLCMPFFNAENEIFIFCQFANWKKISLWQCAHRNQNDQSGSFWQIAHMGTLK